MAGNDLAALQRRLAAIPQAVKNAVKPALERSGAELVGTMRELAPVETGALRDSITATPAGETTPAYSQPGGSEVVPENTVRVTAGNAEVRYPHLVEHGTAEAPAHPFFFPAFRLDRARIQRRITTAINKAAREEWVK